jgi:hypothetical protein
MKALLLWLRDLRGILDRVVTLEDTVESLSREMPGRCGWCGRPTQSREMFWCQDEHQRLWQAKRSIP